MKICLVALDRILMTCTFGGLPLSSSSTSVIIVVIIMTELVCRCETNLIFGDFNTFHSTCIRHFRFLFEVLPVELDVITIVFVCC